MRNKQSLLYMLLVNILAVTTNVSQERFKGVRVYLGSWYTIQCAWKVTMAGDCASWLLHNPQAEGMNLCLACFSFYTGQSLSS